MEPKIISVEESGPPWLSSSSSSSSPEPSALSSPSEMLKRVGVGATSTNSTESHDRGDGIPSSEPEPESESGMPGCGRCGCLGGGESSTSWTVGPAPASASPSCSWGLWFVFGTSEESAGLVATSLGGSCMSTSTSGEPVEELVHTEERGFLASGAWSSLPMAKWAHKHKMPTNLLWAQQSSGQNLNELKTQNPKSKLQNQSRWGMLMVSFPWNISEILGNDFLGDILLKPRQNQMEDRWRKQLNYKETVQLQPPKIISQLKLAKWKLTTWTLKAKLAIFWKWNGQNDFESNWSPKSIH